MRTFLSLLLTSLGLGLAVMAILWPIFWILRIFELPRIFKTSGPPSGATHRATAPPLLQASIRGREVMPGPVPSVSGGILVTTVCFVIFAGAPPPHIGYISPHSKVLAAASSIRPVVMREHAYTP